MTGYIPPALWNGAANDSPIRAQLAAITQAADNQQHAPAA